jgi:DNA-directed RNA polymerase specialized sigma24 family protein
MATDAGKAKARAAVRRAQGKFDRTAEKAREERRETFEQARKSGLTLREIGEAADLHHSSVQQILNE